MKETAQQAFERVCASWGLDFEKNDNGAYTDYATGTTFGFFLMGWDARAEQAC